MTDSIDKLIQDKVKECERIKGPSNYLDDTAIYELMQSYAASEVKRVSEALLLASHHYCMNGIGEVRMINNYELIEWDCKTLDEVVAAALAERAGAEPSILEK